MAQYFCDSCKILDDSEINSIWDDDLCEEFISCKYCGAECSYYDREKIYEEEDLEEEEDLDQ